MTSSSIVILGNPRSGTTYLLRLLASHNEVRPVGEPLNPENGIIQDPFGHVDKLLAEVKKPIVGFKCFPEQLIYQNVRLDDLLRHLRCSTVVVVWRRDLLEMFVSRKIAYMTGEWYSEAPPSELHRIRIDETEFREFVENLQREWSIMGSQWPIEVVPLFAAYEDIASDGPAVATSVLSNLNLDLTNVTFKTAMQRQNPWPLKEKVSNWNELSEESKKLKLDVPRLLSEAIFNSIPGSQENGHLLPHREPPIPSGGWLYRVAEPYLPPEACRNVIDSLNGRCVSSAGHWPKEMADRLRRLFGRPVAQPCVNGFAALVLALQAADVKPGDEVIIPTFTMIAVPNSVHFVGAVPVVVDNAVGQYNPGLKQILEAATEKTKAVIISHTYGVPMEGVSELAEICQQRKWALIEDIAETVGIRDQSTGKLLGSFGDFACASMYANKIAHAGDGGFIIARDSKCDGKLASLVNHGFTRSFHFLHLEPAINAKINGMGAALATGVLDVLDQIMDHRRSVAERYRSRLAATPLRLMPECGLGDTPWVFGVVCENRPQRNALRRHLAQHRIETRDFFLPIHLQPASEKMNGAERRRHLKLPVAEKLGCTGFYLPLFTSLTLDDIDYICDAVVSFFDQRRPVRQAPEKEPVITVSVRPGDHTLEVVEFDRAGRPRRRRYHGHPLIEAVTLKTLFEERMFTSREDERQELTRKIHICLNDAQKLGLDLRHTFRPILDYFETEGTFEPEQSRPWLSEKIDEGEQAQFATIPTTTDPETLQFLAWLINKTQTKRVLELGGWLGRASGLMGAAVLKNAQHIPDDRTPVVYVLDSFCWQNWMNSYLPRSGFRLYESFFDKYRKNMRPLGDVVKPMEWDASDPTMPNDGVLPDDTRFDLVFVDFSEEPEEVTKAWAMVRKHCVPDRTIVVFNGFVPAITPFYVACHRELRPLQYKPHTTARAFLFVNQSDTDTVSASPTLDRKLAFLDAPDWGHHHKNAFVAAVEKLKEKVHDEKATTAFLPGVEEFLCDGVEKLIGRDWIGIIHQVPHNPDLFYHTDLHRLCTSLAYGPALKTCRGLFTLTGLQATYLRENLPRDLGIPVCQLTYPSITNIDPSDHPSVSKLSQWNGQNKIKLAFIGSFARDIDLFYQATVPKNVQKTLVAGDEQLKKWAEKAPEDVEILGRLSDQEYEDLLSTCVAFLSLRMDGAANTLVVECVARGTPIVAPRWSSSCVEYLGQEYPLFYDQPDHHDRLDLSKVLTPERVKAAVDYLSKMDKAKFGIDHFCQNVMESAVMRNVIPTVESRPFGLSAPAPKILLPSFDVTVCICSYKRTHHLPALLDRLWNGQSFKGRLQIIVWNNNEARRGILDSICKPYLSLPTPTRRLELIQSTQNYYCAIRMCMPGLMLSDRLLICDDDVIPEENFVQFFYSASEKYPEDVLCVRGHEFLEHQLDMSHPESFWIDYQSLRFVDDYKPMQFIHFVHADACLLPKAALREWASVDMSDPTFALVDDYWMSFVLNHQFGRNLRKLSTRVGVADGKAPMGRTDDSDTKGLALHTRPEVMDARVRLYMHHMLRGWPTWPKVASIKDMPIEKVEKLKKEKRMPWSKPFVGYNVSSKLSEKDADDLIEMGVTNVRIGAVGVKKDRDYEFSGFNTRPQKQIEELVATIDMLGKRHINVVLTLDPRIDLTHAWSLIAKHCFSRSNVIGYDLINEPASEADQAIGCPDIPDNPDPEGIEKLGAQYSQLIEIVNTYDPVTPILLEPPFWANVSALPRLESIIERIDSDVRSRLLLSFHFYDPPRYTQRRMNRGRYSYPGVVPIWNAPHSPTIKIDRDWIRDRFATAADWAADKSWAKVVIAEAGLCRDAPGANKYLRDTLEVSSELKLPIFLFSFRDSEWEAMDYERGTHFGADTKEVPDKALMDVIKGAISEANRKMAGM